MKKYKLTLIAAAVAFSCGIVQAEEIKAPEDLVDQAGDPKIIDVAPADGYTHVTVTQEGSKTTVESGALKVGNATIQDTAVKIEGKGSTVYFGTEKSKLESVTITSNPDIIDKDSSKRVEYLGYLNNGSSLNVFAGKYAQTGSNKGFWVAGDSNAVFNVNSFNSETRTTAIRALGGEKWFFRIGVGIL